MRRTRKRHRTAAGLVGPLALAGMMLLATPASAASAIGEAADPYYGVICEGPSTYLQVSTGVAPGYAVPADGGVITSWRTLVPENQGGAQVKLGVFRSTGQSAEYTTVGSSSVQTLAPGLDAFPTSVPVQAGDTIGLLIVSGEHNCITINTGSPEDRTQREEGTLFDTGSIHTYSDPSQPARRVNVAATVEADADGDGIGDEPPETKITKGAPRKLATDKVRFKFSSDDPGATFRCRLDKKPYRRCKSPTRINHLDLGKHKFQVRAVDPDGHRDATPAKDGFKVVP